MSDLDHAKSLLEIARGDLNSLHGMLASPSGENFFTEFSALRDSISL